MKKIIFLGFILGIISIQSWRFGEDLPSSLNLKMALLKYNGGGDWYANPTALPNLAYFCNQQLGTNFNTDYATVEVGKCRPIQLFLHPYDRPRKCCLF